MKANFVSLTGALVLAASSSSQATLLFYDSFNYAAGSLGTAGSPTWVKNGASADPTVQNVGGLTYAGLQVSADTMSLQYDGSGIAPAAAATDGTTISTGITNGSVYYSLLMKVTVIQSLVGGTGNGFATGVNLTQGSFMAGLQTLAATGAPVAGSSAAPLLIRSGDGTQFSPTYQIGTSKTATAADRQFYTGQAFGTNDTIFLVLKYTYDAINGDSASLFVNPTPGDPEPASQLTVTAGATLSGATGIRSFFVRNNSVEPDALLIDELRIGDTWGDVTPSVVPEPATATFVGLGALALISSRRLRRR